VVPLKIRDGLAGALRADWQTGRIEVPGLLSEFWGEGRRALVRDPVRKGEEKGPVRDKGLLGGHSGRFTPELADLLEADLVALGESEKVG
jgi:hypothetical protein